MFEVRCDCTQNPREENEKTVSPAKLSGSEDTQLMILVLMEVLLALNIDQMDVDWITKAKQERESWTTSIKDYL